MEIKDVIENYERNYKVEKEILNSFSSILKSYISENEIEKVLEANGFNGIYILPDEIYDCIDVSLGSMGLYSSSGRIIVLKEEEYSADKSIGIHEMGHAFLNNRSRSSIVIDNTSCVYGKGLEEGAVSLLMCTKNANNISEVDPFIFKRQCILFQQLNALYQYSSYKSYPNLLIHMLLKPEEFISLIEDMYKDIYTREYSKVNSYLITKSAFDLIAGTDVITKCECYTKTIYDGLNLINLLYLSIADHDIRSGIVKNPVFATTDLFRKTSEEELISSIMGTEIPYMERMEFRLESLLEILQMEFEKIGNDEKEINKSKIILPR